MYTNRYTLIARPAIPTSPPSPSLTLPCPSYFHFPFPISPSLLSSLRHNKSAKRVRLECCPQIVLVVRRPRRTCCQCCQSIYQFVATLRRQRKRNHIKLYYIAGKAKVKPSEAKCSGKASLNYSHTHTHTLTHLRVRLLRVASQSRLRLATVFFSAKLCCKLLRENYFQLLNLAKVVENLRHCGGYSRIAAENKCAVKVNQVLQFGQQLQRPPSFLCSAAPFWLSSLSLVGSKLSLPRAAASACEPRGGNIAIDR